MCVCVYLSGGTSVALPAVLVKLNTHTSLLEKAKMKDEKSRQADGGTDMSY